jgi:hypothetical protein
VQRAHNFFTWEESLMKSRVLVSLILIALVIALPTAAFADGVPAFEFTTPLFGMDAPADGAAGGRHRRRIVEIAPGRRQTDRDLPGVIDVASGVGICSPSPTACSTRSRGKKNKAGPRVIANLAEFEEAIARWPKSTQSV